MHFKYNKNIPDHIYHGGYIYIKWKENKYD